jgi:RNA polymerase sigma factor (sigma-70 family)
LADERWQTINRAIADLGEEEQRVLWLHDGQNLTLQQVAQVLGIDDLHVERLYAQARERVNARLRDAGHDELGWEPPLPPSLDD